MWQKIFHRLFSRKWELLILGAVVTACAIISKWVAISHWMEINFDMSSYDPMIPIVGIIWWSAYLSILYIRKYYSIALVVMGVLGMIYTLVMFWAIWLRV